MMIFKKPFYYIILFSACTSLNAHNPDSVESNLITEEKASLNKSTISPESHSDLWSRIRNTLSIQLPDNLEEGEFYRKRFMKNQHAVNRITRSGQRYLFHTVTRAEELNVPTELALLPFIESEFDPYAQSIYGATGIWQFLPATGKEWGLKSNWWYDGKRDVLASTEAAYKFLISLNKRFEGDWLLALAAYNAGPSRIKKAIKKNKSLGKPVDFWSLDLPRETKAYIPKLLVLSELIKNPEKYQVHLPPIANRPYFVKVNTPNQLDLMQAADLAGLTPEALYELNPGFSQWATDPSGPYYLLLPTGTGDRFSTQLSSMDRSELVQWDRYKIKRGDNLTIIARKYSIEVGVLKEINQMDNDLIYEGKEIMVPRGPAWAKNSIPHVQTYTVIKGDSFWAISKKFDVTITDLTLWNSLNLNVPLQIGQKLKLFSKYERARGKIPKRKTRTLLYPVKAGDTLSRIASRFSIKVRDIEKWNEMKKLEIIYPGQVLKINLDGGIGN